MSAKRELPAWHQEMGDELNALTVKYLRIARAEGAGDREITFSFLAMFGTRFAHLTPDGFEKRQMVLMGEIFDEIRPGWRGER